MAPHPYIKALYKRVKHLTNIGEHAEATALFDDLNARRLKGIYKHGVIRREA